MNKYLVKLASLLKARRSFSSWGKRVLYHGTADKNINRIRGRGLIPNKGIGDDAYAAAVGAEHIKPKNISYLTSDINLAAKYNYAGNKTARILSGKESGRPHTYTDKDIRKIVRKFKSGSKKIGIAKVTLPVGKYKRFEDPSREIIKLEIEKAKNIGRKGRVQMFREGLKHIEPELRSTMAVKGPINKKYIK